MVHGRGEYGVHGRRLGLSGRTIRTLVQGVQRIPKVRRPGTNLDTLRELPAQGPGLYVPQRFLSALTPSQAILLALLVADERTTADGCTDLLTALKKGAAFAA
jgi:hypothetical protein